MAEDMAIISLKNWDAALEVAKRRSGNGTPITSGELAQRIEDIPNQKPEVQGKETITTNGVKTFAPPDGSVFNSFEVTTDTPEPKPEQEKTVNITEPGTYNVEVTPDAGKTMNKVIAKVDVKGGGGGFPNGTEWVKVPNLSGKFNDVYSSDNIIVLAGENGLYYSEDDGASWTKSNIATSVNVVKCGNNIWAAGGTEGLWISADGKSWSLNTLAKAPITALEECAGYLLAGGTNADVYLCSTVGWSSVESSRMPEGTIVKNISSAGSNWMISTSAGLYHSGATLAPNAILPVIAKINKADILKTIESDGELVSCTGSMGAWLSTLPNVKKFRVSNLSAGLFNDAYESKGVWALAGESGLYYSLDYGATWTQSNVSTPISLVCAGNGIWIASGTDGQSWWSSDAITWQKSNVTNNKFNKVVQIGGKWLAVANDGVYSSVIWAPTV